MLADDEQATDREHDACDDETSDQCVEPIERGRALPVDIDDGGRVGGAEVGRGRDVGSESAVAPLRDGGRTRTIGRSGETGAREGEEDCDDEGNPEHLNLLGLGPLAAADIETLVCPGGKERNTGCRAAARTVRDAGNPPLMAEERVIRST